VACKHQKNHVAACTAHVDDDQSATRLECQVGGSAWFSVDAGDAAARLNAWWTTGPGPTLGQPSSEPMRSISETISM
jgi:hypothetical protein